MELPPEKPDNHQIISIQVVSRVNWNDTWYIQGSPTKNAGPWNATLIEVMDGAKCSLSEAARRR